MKLVIVATHPIQYQVPLFRMLNKLPDLDVEAYFLSDHSVRGGVDAGFGVGVKWDVPLLEGYESRFLNNQGPGSEGNGFLAYRYSGFYGLFREIKPDAILVPGHSVLAYWQAVFAAYRLGIPVLVRPESLDGAQPDRPNWKTILRMVLLSRFYKRISIFCATGKFSYLDALKFGFKSDQIVESPYCIDTDLFERRYWDVAPQRDSIRNDMRMRPDAVGILFVGKMIDWKNPMLILEALAILSKDDRSRFFPIFVGSGPELEKVRLRCLEVVGKGFFCCPGFVNQTELCRYYVAGDLFVLPSKKGHESWGLVVNEAMTCGLPVIVSDGVGCRDNLVEESVTGYVFQDGNAMALSKHLNELSKSTELRKKMSLAARKLVEKNSSTKAVQGIVKASRLANQKKITLVK